LWYNIYGLQYSRQEIKIKVYLKINMKTIITPQLNQDNGRFEKPKKNNDRKEMIKQAVERTMKEYGEAIRKLGDE
jgi:hypothetical protein